MKAIHANAANGNIAKLIPFIIPINGITANPRSANNKDLPIAPPLLEAYTVFKNFLSKNINTIPIPINKNKKKKKVAKFKLNQLKELRENEFKIDKNKINKKEDENVEEYIEKYFDKDGKCIGGKKTVIKQEYENGQKIIKKFVEEKYKSNSSYEFLKKQEENNYDIHNKKSSKKETIISSSKNDF